MIKIKKLHPNATLPTRGSEHAAGYDLYACLEKSIGIEPGQTVKIPTGLAMELPENTFMGIYARSGLATKYNIRPANCVGICDSDYRGEYIVALYNDGDTPMIIEPNMRIAQCILQPFIPATITEVDILSNTKRDTGGFGSTGDK